MAMAADPEMLLGILREELFQHGLLPVPALVHGLDLKVGARSRAARPHARPAAVRVAEQAGSSNPLRSRPALEAQRGLRATTLCTVHSTVGRAVARLGW